MCFVNAVGNRRWGLSRLTIVAPAGFAPHPRAGRKRKTTRTQRSGERRDEADAGGKKARRCGSTRAGVIRRSESRRALSFSKAIALLQADEKSTAPLFAGER
jgi:hypothetical protein